jgi:MFS family permease
VSNAAFSICFMFGPGLGGTLVAAGSTSLALLVNAAIFAACGLNLATARGLPEPAPDRAQAKGRVRAALAYVREVPQIGRLFLLQAIGVLFFTISVPVEVVFATHSLHASAAGYGGMVSAWGAGAVAGAAVYARWRARPNRELIVGGAAFLGLGFVVMAAAPSLAVAIIGAALGGIGNGVESVAARTAIQEEASERWMAMMMSLYEALFQSVPGAGMLIGGGITALGSPRTALAVAGAGSLAVTVAAWFALTGLGSRMQPHAAGAAATQADGAPGPQSETARDPQADGHRPAPRRDASRTPAVRHQ